MNIDIDVLRNIVEEQIPIHKFLGVELLEIKEGYAKVRVPFQEMVLGDIVRRRWHGGILATIMDSVGSLTGAAYFSSPQDKMATIDMRIDYLKGAEAAPIIVEGKIVRLGRRILVTKMHVWDEQEETLLAEGKGVYNFIRMKDDQKDPNAFLGINPLL
ncbi:MAG: PaaI family thioesterase [Aureispira sp.]